MIGLFNTLALFIIQIFIISVICETQQPNGSRNLLFSTLNRLRGHQKISNVYNSSANLVALSLLAEPLINSYLEGIQGISKDINNTRCVRQISHLATGLIEFEPWALKMLDSSSKIPSGVLIGNLKDIGFYDECMSVKIEKDNDIIQGRHCMYSVANEKHLMITPTFSICLPSACNPEDLRDMLQIVINAVSNMVNVSIGVQSVTCSAVEPEPFDVGTILTIVFLCVFLGFLTCCTIHDFYLRAIGEKCDSALVKFSIYTNALKMLNTKAPKGNIAAIQGIRFFSTCWVILGHTYFLQMIGVMANGTDVLVWLKSWSSIYIQIATFTVDTFFTISGFLSSYLFMKHMARDGKFNVVTYYLHRYLRLTPAFVVLLLLTIFIFPKLGSGALWDRNMKEQEQMCKSNWWPMLLYIQNYVKTENLMCLIHLWYLAVDMQLFWISPIVLYPLAKKPKIGLSILAVLFIISIIIPAMIAVKNKYSGGLFMATTIEEIVDNIKNFYIVTYTRMGPWLLGILLGYFLSQNRRVPSITLITIGWILTVLAFTFIFFSYRVFQADGYIYNVYWELFYNGFSRHIWAFAICWLLYILVTGYAERLKKFLSHPFFLFFGRISYCVYLFHFIFQTMQISSIRVPVYFSDCNMLSLFFSNLIICTFGGFVFSLLFESPFVAFEKLIFGEKKIIRKHRSCDQLHEGVENGKHHIQNIRNISHSVENNFNNMAFEASVPCKKNNMD